MESSISLEETNKIRISLGLKPLGEPSAPVQDKEKEAEDNYSKRKEAEAREKERRFVYLNRLSIQALKNFRLYFALPARQHWSSFLDNLKYCIA